MDGEHIKFRERRGGLRKNKCRIIDHQQSWGDEDGPWKGRGHLYWWPLIFYLRTGK
jgi:hypothetical protein